MASASTTVILICMSTRASIRFIDEYNDVVYVYRGHDGFPEIVESDIDRVLSIASGRWSCSEVFGGTRSSKLGFGRRPAINTTFYSFYLEN